MSIWWETLLDKKDRVFSRRGCSQLEDNVCGQLNSNSNNPSDFRGDDNTILVGAPKTNQQFNLTA